MCIRDSKTTTPGNNAPGDTKVFTITITNQGTLDAYNIDIIDYIPSGYTFSAANATNATNGWTASGANATTNIVGPLAAGGSTSVDIALTLDANFMGTSLVNVAEISAADDDTNSGNTPPTDIDSTPDSNPANDAGGSPQTASDNTIAGDGTGNPGDIVASTDEDDSDPSIVNVAQDYDLALTKTITSMGPYAPGDSVTYEITVTNEGTLDATNIEVTDVLPAGLTFVSGTGFTATAPYTSTIASIPAGGAPAVLTLDCLLYTSPSPRDGLLSRMPSSA